MSANDLRASDRCLALIAKEEGGYQLKAMRCFAGKWTNGLGHLMGLPDGAPQPPPITMAQAVAQFRLDIRRFEDVVNKVVAVPLAQHEFDALVSFTFNVGAGALAASTLLKYLNAGRRDEAAEQFLVWSRYTNPKTGRKETSPTLLGRRRRERLMFLGEGVLEPPPDAA